MTVPVLDAPMDDDDARAHEASLAELPSMIGPVPEEVAAFLRWMLTLRSPARITPAQLVAWWLRGVDKGGWTGSGE